VGKAVNEKIEVLLVPEVGVAYIHIYKMIQAFGEFFLMSLLMIAVPLGLFVGTLLLSVIVILL
jgi:hypothetical protein